jgi:hypothetical protein
VHYDTCCAVKLHAKYYFDRSTIRMIIYGKTATRQAARNNCGRVRGTCGQRDSFPAPACRPFTLIPAAGSYPGSWRTR